MSATATQASPLLGVPKVSRAWRGAVEVNDVRDRIREEAKRDAERLLKAATRRFPLPIYAADIARQLGVRVLELKLTDDDTIGGLMVEPGDDPKIVLNESYGLLHRRVTCALELGYYVRLSPEQRVYQRADLRSLRAEAKGEDPEERYADEFAECLLMPEDDVRVMSELGLNDLEMALKFWLPREIVWSRLESLGLLVDAGRAA
jgi:Zn-dependent peptidase ImmA (M78 family)